LLLNECQKGHCLLVPLSAVGQSRQLASRTGEEPLHPCQLGSDAPLVVEEGGADGTAISTSETTVTEGGVDVGLLSGEVLLLGHDLGDEKAQRIAVEVAIQQTLPVVDLVVAVLRRTAALWD